MNISPIARVAGGLASLGVRAGDGVVIYMPMIPEAPITMLARARLGAVHSVVFGGFERADFAKLHRGRGNACHRQRFLRGGARPCHRLHRKTA